MTRIQKSVRWVANWYWALSLIIQFMRTEAGSMKEGTVIQVHKMVTKVLLIPLVASIIIVVAILVSMTAASSNPEYDQRLRVIEIENAKHQAISGANAADLLLLRREYELHVTKSDLDHEKLSSLDFKMTIIVWFVGIITVAFITQAMAKVFNVRLRREYALTSKRRRHPDDEEDRNQEDLE